MKHRFLGTLLLILLLGALLAAPAAAKSYSAERYDVTLAVQPDGALIVTETVTFRFEGGPFTYVFRDLNYANLDVIDRLQASMDGQALPQGTGAGQVEVVAGNPLKVTWHFAPTSDAIHTFTLVYRVQGALRHEAAADALRWIAIPEEHEYPIRRSTIRLEYPAGVTPLSAPVVEGWEAALESADQAVVFNLQEIEEDTPVVVSAQFPSGSLVQQAPAWQRQQEQRASQRAAALPWGIGAALATVLLGAAGLFLAGLSFRRDAAGLPGAPSMHTMPPRQISPALAARLAGSSTGFLGALFDLAERGVITIEEGQRRWGSSTFELVRQPSAEPLQKHEQALLQALFRKAKNERVPLTQAAVISGDRAFNQALDEELTALGWRDAERAARRGRFLTFTVLGLFLGLAALLAGALLSAAASASSGQLAALGAILIGGGAALGLVGLVGSIAAGSISVLSDEGLRQAEAWKGFNAHLRSIAKGREPATAPDTFARYLAYAAAFGMGTQWGKFFQKMGDVPLPAWMQTLDVSMQDGSYAAMMAVISSADSSAASAAAGAAGASGGGASGAG